MDADDIGKEVSKAFGPLEWFRSFNDTGGLVVTTNWPHFDKPTADKIASKLNEVLRPHVMEIRRRLADELERQSK